MSAYDTSLDDEPQDYFNNATLRMSDVKNGRNRNSTDKDTSPAKIDSSSLFSLDIALNEAKAEARSSNSASLNQQSDAVIPWSGEDASAFFASREGFVKRAIQECSKQLVDDKIGKLLGAWLLTEISLWDNEKERLILLSTDDLIIVKYDFIALRILESKKIPLSSIDSLINGDLVYPNGSFVPSRNMVGVRAMWNKGEPLDFLTKWNVFSNDVPWFTVTSHPLLWCKESSTEEKKLYCIDNFYADFVKAIELASATTPCNIQHKPILLENYIGLTSFIHNKCSLGFFKIRGKFSF